jgi:hypothetical protein
VGTLRELPTNDESGSRPRPATQLRLVSVFRQGWMTIRVTLLNDHRLPLGRFAPEPWPQPSTDNIRKGTSEMLLAA